MKMFSKKKESSFSSLNNKNTTAREVKVSVVFTRLGEIDTINERFACEATLFVTWCEDIDILEKNEFDIQNDDYIWDPKMLWGEKNEIK
jgi:hypothetical protein